MKTYNIFTITFLTLLFINCGGEKKQERNLFTIQIANAKKNYTTNQTLSLDLTNRKEKEITAINYSLDNNVLETVKGSGKLEVELQNLRLGKHIIKAEVTHEDGFAITTKTITIVASKPPKIYNYEILETYPHDITAYTQGLEFRGDTLYESTGQYKQSTIRKTDLKTGKVFLNKKLDDKFFGEGLTILDNKVYQLTWLKKTGLIYDPETLTQQRTFSYGKSTQGWGLCNDGENIYKSDGTEKIWTLDKETLVEKKYIEVYTHTSKVDTINELEMVKNKIYANIYRKDAIAIINPENGAVEGVINLKGLKSKVTKHPKLDVLNGIAYKGEENILYVTGKNWDKLFKIKIIEK